MGSHSLSLLFSLFRCFCVKFAVEWPLSIAAIDFLDLEERLWWQVHSIFRDTAKLSALTSCPETLTVEIGQLTSSEAGLGGQLEKTISLSVSTKLTIGELVDQAVAGLQLDSPRTAPYTYVLLRYNRRRQRPRPGPIAHRQRLVDADIQVHLLLDLRLPG